MRNFSLGLCTKILMIVIITTQSSGLHGADLDFEYNDEPSYVTVGENGSEHPDGNCVGGGCGDRPERVRAENRGADHFDQERYEFEKYGNNYERDADGQYFERGDDGSADRLAGEHWTDRSELYYDSKGRDYVKSRDGKCFLPIDDLLQCSRSLSCYQAGYKSNWWAYPSFPGENSSEASEYFENADFAKNSHKISLAVEELNGKVDSAFLGHVTYLNQESNKEFIGGYSVEAKDTQRAAMHLVGLFLDVGIGFTPLGWARDVYEFTTGKALIDGRQLSFDERVLAGLGVAIPGVVPLAVAGVKIVKRAAAIDKSLALLLPSINKFTQLPNGLKPIRFKAGSSSNKVAIIGRDMNVVKSVEAHLLKNGIDVKIFSPSPASIKMLEIAGEKYPAGRVPYELISKTHIYRENVEWVSVMKSEGRAFIDYGDPNGKNIKDGFSAFYDREILMIFGK